MKTLSRLSEYVCGCVRVGGGRGDRCEVVYLYPAIMNISLLHLTSYTHSLVQAEYWQDPLNEAEYRQKCIFLPEINQENVGVA